MGMYSLDIFSSSDIPYSYCLVTTAGSKNTLMSRMPYSLVSNEIMKESSFTASWHIDIPELN